MISQLRILEIFSFELSENKCLSIKNLTRIIILIYAHLGLTKINKIRKRLRQDLLPRLKMLYKYSEPNQISSI